MADTNKTNLQTTVVSDVLSASSSGTLSLGKSQTARVMSVVDGDTIKVDIDGQTYTVRYIGIDTPETVDPRRPVGCFGTEAKEKNRTLVEGRTVTLVHDVSDTDKYGRLLRYVYVDSVFVNNQLVLEGYANASAYPPDVHFQSLFRQSEKTARELQKGLWGTCLVPTRTVQTMTSSLCAFPCSGIDQDCKDFKTRQEAQEYFTCCSFSAEYDPMNLDDVGVGNGLACETLP